MKESIQVGLLTSVFFSKFSGHDISYHKIFTSVKTYAEIFRSKYLNPILGYRILDIFFPQI